MSKFVESGTKGTHTDIVVYYIVGRPRSGSTFVGDWIARELGILNAGEVWQTLRTLKALRPGALKDQTERWTQPKARASKKAGNPSQHLLVTGPRACPGTHPQQPSCRFS